MSMLMKFCEIFFSTAHSRDLAVEFFIMQLRLQECALQCGRKYIFHYIIYTDYWNRLLKWTASVSSHTLQVSDECKLFHSIVRCLNKLTMFFEHLKKTLFDLVETCKLKERSFWTKNSTDDRKTFWKPHTTIGFVMATYDIKSFCWQRSKHENRSNFLCCFIWLSLFTRSFNTRNVFFLYFIRAPARSLSNKQYALAHYQQRIILPTCNLLAKLKSSLIVTAIRRFRPLYEASLEICSAFWWWRTAIMRREKSLIQTLPAIIKTT